MLPPTISTTPNSPSVCATVMIRPLRMPRHAARARRVVEIGGNGLERALGRNPGERDVEDDAGDEQAGKGERERMAHERRVELAEGGLAAERDEEVVAEHGRRQ